MGARSGMATERACRREMTVPRVGRRGTVRRRGAVRRRRTGGSRGGIFWEQSELPAVTLREGVLTRWLFIPLGELGGGQLSVSWVERY